MAGADATDAEPISDNVVRLARTDRREGRTGPSPHPEPPSQSGRIVNFDRAELRLILNLYGRQVAAGEWRDYAIDFSRESAEFSVMRRSNEYPVYRIRKVPALAKKQGAFSVVSVTGYILKRGHDLRKVLSVLEPKTASLHPC